MVYDIQGALGAGTRHLQTPSHTGRGLKTGAAAVSGEKPVGESCMRRRWTVLQCDRLRCSGIGSCRQWIRQSGDSSRSSSQTYSPYEGRWRPSSDQHGKRWLCSQRRTSIFVISLGLYICMRACCSDPCKACKGPPGPSHALLKQFSLATNGKNGGGYSGFVSIPQSGVTAMSSRGGGATL